MNSRINLLLGTILVLLLLSRSAYVLDQRAVAVLLEFDRYKATVTEPGLHFKLPFAQTVHKMDKRLLTARQTSNIPLSGQDSVDVDFYVKWRIADIATYYHATGGQARIANDRLVQDVDGSLRGVLGNHSVEQIITGDRDQLDDSLREAAQHAAHDLGLEVADVRIRTLTLPKDVAQAYLDRMRAERKRVAEDLRSRGKQEAEQIRAAADNDAQTTLAQAYRQSETLRGEGDGKAAEIYDKVYGQDPEFYAFYRSLNAYRDAFQGQRDVLVIEPKGEFFKYFKDAGK